MIFHVLLLFIPVSLGLWLFGAPPLWVFATAMAAIVPLAEWTRRGTEQVAIHAGPVIGGLLNVTFGNSAELILALFVLHAGKIDVVKATITGSIIGNSLVGLGLAILVGSWGRQKQKFGREHAGLLSSLQILCVIALIIPALFDYTERGLYQHAADAPALDEKLSLGVACVLIFLYLANLAYTLVTHRDLFAREQEEVAETEDAGHDYEKAEWSLAKSLGVLLVATLAVAVEADLVSGALEHAAESLGLTTFFLGIIVLPVVGNAAEYLSAVYFARQDKMGLVMSIAVGSSIQVALLTAPLLVLVSYAMGTPMNLVFSNPLELIAIAGVAFAVNSIAQDGETTWFEGMLLLGVYALLGMAFFFATP
jgi:Ca2+:H+ antiporter